MYRIIDKLARMFALLGGLALSLLIFLTCFSVAGRSMNSILHSDFIQDVMPGFAASLLATGVGPINGDFEIIEAGVAFAIFAFLPLCQLHAAHASVDIFTAALPERVNRFLRTIIEVVFAAVMVLIALQLSGGMMSKFNSGQTTLLLQFPVWWSYAFSLCAAVMAAIVAVFVAGARVLEVVKGRSVLPDDVGAAH